MPPTTADLACQEQLKLALQADVPASKLENLAAALLGRLLGIPIAVAKTGFQHGGDAGPAGQQGRRFRLECKKYSDTTSLSDRELLGEIDHALARDEALEAWFLIATRSVPEQLAQDLIQKGERLGIPVVIIDWRNNEIVPLAALCASEPDLVEAEFSKDAAAHARALQPAAGSATDVLRRSLQSWSLGFERLRAHSHDKLAKIWTSPRTSNAELAQDAAGGARPNRVTRASVQAALNAWWQGAARDDAPCAIVGWDGVGKTWAALDWLVSRKTELPVILIVPSSAAAKITGASETALKRFIAERLYELSGVRGADHWLRRLDYLLKRPASEGPVFALFFDGLNQEPSVPWLAIMKVLQSDVFAGRVRVVASSRTHYFQERLAKLRGLVVPAVPIAIDVYDAAPGGELDQMLAFERLSRADLHPDLIELARTPRLFTLVVRFRDRLVDAGNVTVHRLLWEYGRDTFGARAGRSFSEAEWQEWLKEIATRHRAGVVEYTTKTLAETASRPDLTEREVYARLSDIIDGQFARPGPSGSLQLTPTVVAHALGAALLAHLDSAGAPDYGAIEAELLQWLDPIAGLDQRAEILRAAVAILVERGGPASTPIAGVLVTAWLQTQNVADEHRRELAVFAPVIPNALLDAVERSDAHTHASARLWAVNALRAIARTEGPALDAIIARTRAWLSIVSREVDHSRDANPDFEKRRADRYKEKIGIDASGPLTVLGVPLELVDRDDGTLQAAVPLTIEGFPLARALPCFEAAAVAFAVRGHVTSWNGLKWLCYLNEVDPLETAEGLRQLSSRVRARTPERGIHTELPARAAALLLWLSGEETDEEAAAQTDPGIDRAFSYEEDYLANPSRSFFALERRHADIALLDQGVVLAVRIQRTKEFWLDPSFQPPAPFVEELRTAGAAIDVGKLNRDGSYTREDHFFEDLQPALARCAPDLLAELCRRKMQSYATCPPQSRYWAAIHAPDNLILAADTERGPAQTLRLRARDTDDGQEAVAATRLFMIELQGLDILAQFDRVIAAGLKFISREFVEILNVPTTQDSDTLIGRYRDATSQQQHDLVLLLSIHQIDFSDEAWAWLSGLARQSDHKLRGVLFHTLARANAGRFGRMLAADGWSWDPKADFWVNHYGTGAFIEAGAALPFEQLAPRLAPWRLLEAARTRGADVAEVRLAAEIFGHVLAAAKIEEPDPGSNLSVERSEKEAKPFVLSAEPRPSPEQQNNPFASLRAALNADARIKAYQRATETAISRIDEARAAGASLYLTDVAAEDLAPVLQHAPAMVDRWLEGHHERSADFRRRVRLAEAAYLALCEAMLAFDPGHGADLWRALRKTMATRYIGPAGIDELLHMVFRAPESPAVAALRDELLGLPRCHTDRSLFELALAASYNGKSAWLTAAIETDRRSPLVWRQKRALVLDGFRVSSSLPIDGAWPDGQICTDHAQLRHQSARRRFDESSGHHWWRVYLAAATPAEAYAAWILFLHAADGRAWTWMREDVQRQNSKDAFFDRKLKHVQFNGQDLKRAMEKKLDKLDKNFLGHDTVFGVGPWGKADLH
jgi:hypothetical protein